MAGVKITVVKRMDNKELFGNNPPLEFTGIGTCDRVKDGQEFICKEGAYPEGFCSWAYADIQRDIIYLRLGGDYPWFKEKGAILASCTDGARPVIFKLERISMTLPIISSLRTSIVFTTFSGIDLIRVRDRLYCIKCWH